MMVVSCTTSEISGLFYSEKTAAFLPKKQQSRYLRLFCHNGIRGLLASLKCTIAIRLKIQTKSGHKTHKSQLLRPDFVN